MKTINSTLRLNMTSFDMDGDLNAQRYQAALDMAAYVDGFGFTAVNVEEHHGTDIGWLPSPLIMASAIIASPIMELARKTFKQRSIIV